MNRRIIVALGAASLIATTAFAQWAPCTSGPAVGSSTCSTHEVGIGNTVPVRNIVISGGGTSTFQLSTRGGAPTATDGFQFQQVGAASHLINEENGIMAFWTNANQRMTIDATGRVGIGTAAPAFALDIVGAIHSTGDITSNGSIAATYQDVAEWVPSETDLQPGTVVVISVDSDDHVMPSSAAYSTAVAGVVSAQPGLVLGHKGLNKEAIATTGRVKVHATAQNGAIKRGDLLVTSDIPGTAMRSQPVSINGRTFHQPGTIIGKALEPLAEGSGEIMVLLSLQ